MDKTFAAQKDAAMSSRLAALKSEEEKVTRARYGNFAKPAVGCVQQRLRPAR
jgi:hypothetical protein